ncbi:MAG: hypothetical protein KDB37_16325 [Ilumatobacter sp.]|nr:hypothetical protein [Ilumatobacter sp.]
METIIAEGDVADIAGTRFDGVTASDGRTPFINSKEFTGDLVGTARVVASFVVASFVVGEDAVEAEALWDFSGELAGVGTGTFSMTNSASMDKFGGPFESSGEIIGLTGAFEGLSGTIVLDGTKFGSEATYRVEFAPASDGSAMTGPLSTDEAAAFADEFAIAFTARDFARIEQRLGPDGTWVAISGDVYDASTVIGFLGSFDFITSIQRIDVSVEGPEGVAFEMFETFDGGASNTFWLAVSRDEGGALTFTEYKTAPA